MMTMIWLLMLPLGAMGATCGDKDGTGVAVICGAGFSSKSGSTSCDLCDDDGHECCLCGFDDWGSGIPFADGKNVGVADDLNNGNLNVTFTLATQPCVDREEQLSVSFRETGEPVCQAVAPADADECAARLAIGKSECGKDKKCRYRIVCAPEDLALEELFLVQKTRMQNASETEYIIAIRTGLLSTQGANAGIYTAPENNNAVAKIELCIRPSVNVGGLEVLFREVVASVSMDMTGGVSLSIQSDSYDAAGLQDVEAEIDFTTDAFACQSTQSNGVVTYEKVPPAPLTPNSVLTLCVTGTRSTIHCADIQDLVFQQGETTNENRISNFAATSILTEKTTEVSISADGLALTGCVVAARLGGTYFQGLNPENIMVTGTALLDFVPTTGRRLLRDASQSTALVVHRKLQQTEQVSDFGTEFSIAQNSGNAIQNTDAAVNDVAGSADVFEDSAGVTSHCVTTGLTVATSMLMTV